MKQPFANLPVIAHAGFLEELQDLPAYLTADSGFTADANAHFAWLFSSAGSQGKIRIQEQALPSELDNLPQGRYLLRCFYFGQEIARHAVLRSNGQLEVPSEGPLVTPGGVLIAQLEHDEFAQVVLLREVSTQRHPEEAGVIHQFLIYRSSARIAHREIMNQMPPDGLVKFKISVGEQRPLHPLHISPSVLDVTGRRVPLFYGEAVERFADLLLAHRPPYGRTLVYTGGESDYFSQLATHEVFRLLGVRNLSGSGELGNRALSRSQELLTGQESPFIRLEQALQGPQRFFLLSGWNGFVTHLPVLDTLLRTPDLDAYLVEVVVSETAKALAAKLGSDRVLLIKPGTDSHLALAVAHEILNHHPQAIDQRFISQFADPETFEDYAALAKSEIFAPERVAASIAPEPAYEERLLHGIRAIARKLIEKVPVHIPGSGLSQSRGVVPHCLWSNALAMVGKYGLRPDGQLAGGVLRLTSLGGDAIQGLGMSPHTFLGNIPLSEEGAKEAAERMGLPPQAYQRLLREPDRPFLDFSEPTQAGQRELIVCIGTGLERQLVDRSRWLNKLRSPDTTLVVIDANPSPFLLKHAALIIPPPPEVATSRLYLTGDWNLNLSLPRRCAPPETRTEATILYDTMAEISRSLREDADYREGHPDLAELVQSGYLQSRFEAPEWGWGGTLPRQDGEVCRAHLWQRLLSYMQGLYCHPTHASGQAIAWAELLQAGALPSGGVGHHRQLLKDLPDYKPFSDHHGKPCDFSFFVPKEADLAAPAGIVLSSGTPVLSDDKQRVRFAIASHQTQRTVGVLDMPLTRNLYISFALAEELGVHEGQPVRITHNGNSLVLPAQPVVHLKGRSAYLDTHYTQAEVGRELPLTVLSSARRRCPYSDIATLKTTTVTLEPQEENPYVG